MSRPERSKRVGIRDVATEAGVSVTTVSHALNGKGRLPESTRAHVRDVADRLGYRPNPSAQQLVGGRTGLLGLTIAHPGTGSPSTLTDVAYFVQLLSAASTTALSRGYALVLSTSGSEGEDAWQRTALDGAVVVDPVADDPTVANLRASGTPVVTTGRVPHPEADDDEGLWVDNDHVDGTRRLLAHLERAGAQRIALISAPLSTSYAHDLHETYRGWCAKHDQPPDVVIAGDDLGEGAGFAAASRLLDRGRPDAILAALDRLALGAQLAATTRGLDVPGDLLIAGYSDSEANLHARPSLTALHLRPEQIGRQAVELLIDVVEDRDPPRRQLLIPVRLVARGSTRRVASPVDG